jgi:hypothetical protein
MFSRVLIYRGLSIILKNNNYSLSFILSCPLMTSLYLFPLVKCWASTIFFISYCSCIDGNKIIKIEWATYNFFKKTQFSLLTYNLLSVEF